MNILFVIFCSVEVTSVILGDSCNQSSNCSDLLLVSGKMCGVTSPSSFTIKGKPKKCQLDSSFCVDKCGLQYNGCSYEFCQDCPPTCLGATVCSEVECGVKFDNCYEYYCGTCSGDKACHNNTCQDTKCGDGVCEGKESCSTCPGDCGICNLYQCNEDNCKLPNCRCATENTPNNMDPKGLPQFILLTIDDAIFETHYTLAYRPLLTASIKDSRGRTPTITFYNNNAYTLYNRGSHVMNLGAEIASHTFTHTSYYGTNFSTWFNEYSSSKRFFKALAEVEVRGVRSPKLEWNEDEFTVLKLLNFRYDASLIESVYGNTFKKLIWPFTLDYGCPQINDANMKGMLNKRFKGLWEIPLSDWVDEFGEGIDSMDYKLDGDLLYKYLVYNFERHYNTTKSPFGIYLHGPWFTPSRVTVLLKFLQEVMEKYTDVFFGTSSDIIDYMTNPITSFEYRKKPVKKVEDIECPFGTQKHRCEFSDMTFDTCYICTQERTLMQNLVVRE
ncbi:hypothetical protein EIN_283600 [Entamoeba invadens IP1]|uniref:NodB homology domain-containing protein n=1 Tax=Entamoeba invadens IP1 TaxID=370355 RepID=L7FKH3_ENTIV|nr:hypothetical protein EIN_283600 [Entamoeba invadens IP1]ELP84814.1 hypothetical protein EIN_283600 [Entamoeba invadens IP1]|eukprot:XP_004184160.1 hypothetical protein EIN_283600 [Entamoeba invadens IP1]